MISSDLKHFEPSHGPSGDASKPAFESRSKGVSLLDLLLILLDRKWLIGLGTILAGIGSIFTVLMITSEYTAVAVVLPSQQKMGLPLGSMLGDNPMSGLMKSLDLFGQDDNGRSLSILDSRRLAEKVITRFDLEERYGFKKKKKYYIENVLKEYRRNVWVEEDDFENIRICVKDTSPEMAARMANYIVDQLDSISYQVSQASARGSRLFFENRLKLIRLDLDSAHRAFAQFQVANNFLDLETQVKSSIEALAGVEAEVIATDIEREMIASNFGSNSRMAEVKKRKEVLSGRMKQYMEKGSGSLVLPLNKTPELGIKYANLFRDVKVQEGIHGFVLQMYEQAKFQEANNSPVVTMLEEAKPPQKRTSPKRMVLCLTITLAAFSLLVTWALLAHWYRSERFHRTETHSKLRLVAAHFLPRR